MGLLISFENKIFDFIIHHRYKSDIVQKANNENVSNKDFGFYLYKWLEDEKEYKGEINLYYVNYDKIRTKLQYLN